MFFSDFFRRRRLRKSQQILPYWNGAKTVYGDPFRLWRELIHGADFVVDEMLIGFVDAGREPETTKVIEHVCRVFGVTRWDRETGKGLTDLEIIGILLSVFQWTNAVKKNSSPGPTSPASTESTSSMPPEAPAEVTRPPSPSGCC